jgi:WD40 repeat protein
VTIDANGHILQWDSQEDSPLITTVPGVNVGAPVSASPGNLVLVASPTQVTVYDPSNAVEHHQSPFATGNTPISGISVSPDGTRFVVVYEDGRLELRDAASGDLVIAFSRPVHTAAYNRSFELSRGPVVTLDRRGTRVAYEDSSNQIDVVDDKGTTVDAIVLSSRRRDLQSLDLNDDGSELVVSTNFGEAIWYDESGIAAWQIAPEGKGYDAQFVSDERVATVGGGEVQIIDPRARQTTKQFTVGLDVTRLAVDSTGRLWATAQATGSIQIWDAGSATSIGGALLIRNLVSAPPIRFSADGHYLLVSGPEETTWINVRTADWPGIACRLTGPLSPAERALGSLGKSESCP